MNQNDFEQEKQYVWHDGVRISDEQLVTLAKNAGCYTLAEHYLLSLLAHGTMYGLTYYINKVNEVRAHYGVIPIPTPKLDDDQGCRKTCYTPMSLDDQARKKYRAMSLDERYSLLKVCLMIMMENHTGIFRSRTSWIGIYLVIRDRLDSNLSKKGFEKMARSITPDSFPEFFRIGYSTLSNYSHYISFDDREEAYYDMENNPWEDLCDEFWKVVKDQLFT